MPMQTLSLFFLVAVAIGGIGWVFIYPILSGERKTEQRLANVAKAEPVARVARQNQRARRDTVENTLKEIEQRHKRKRLPISAGIGCVFFVLGIVTGAGMLAAVALGFAGAFGVPYWLLSYLKKRRENKFLDAFPDAVDVIVRGVKAGLPLLDCLKMITVEAPEPLKSEFRAIVETQAVGLP